MMFMREDGQMGTCRICGKNFGLMGGYMEEFTGERLNVCVDCIKKFRQISEEDSSRVNSSEHINLSNNEENAKKVKGMKIWKIVSGIISLLIMLIILNSGYSMIDYANEYGVPVYEEIGFSHMAIGIFLFPLGIVSLVTAFRNNKGCNIAIVVLGLFAMYFGYFESKLSFGGIVCATWSLACVIVAIINLINIKEYS